MQVKTKTNQLVDVQLVEDTGWENLMDDYAVAGRILNGFATIRFYNVSFTSSITGSGTKFLELPAKYKPARTIYFPLSKGTNNPTLIMGRVMNSTPAEIQVVFNEIGSQTLYGFVTYPVG